MKFIAIIREKYLNDPLFEAISGYVNKLDEYYLAKANDFKAKFEGILHTYRFSNRHTISKNGIVPHIMLSKEPDTFEIKLFFDWDGGIGNSNNETEVLLEDPGIYCKELWEVFECYEDIHLNYLVTWLAMIWQDVRIDDDSLIVVLSENSTTHTFVFNDLAWDDFSSYRFIFDISKPVEVLQHLDIVTIYGRVLRTYPYNKYKYVEHYYSNNEKIFGIAFYRNLFVSTQVVNNCAERTRIESFNCAFDLIKYVNTLEIEYSSKGFKGTIIESFKNEPLIGDAYNFNIQCNNPDIYREEKYNYYYDEINNLENKIGIALPSEYKMLLRIITSNTGNTYRVQLREKINGKAEVFRFYNLNELHSLSNMILDKHWMIIGSLYSEGYICLSLNDTKTLNLFSKSNSKGISIATQLEDIWKTHLIY